MGSWQPVQPASLEVAFDSADLGTSDAIAVAAIEAVEPTDTALERGLAVLHLATEVPAAKLSTFPPLYLRRVATLLREGTDPFVVGFGCTSGAQSCTDDGVRRRGSIVSSITLDETSVPHRLKAQLDAQDAKPFRNDLGGPLFIFDPVSARYVVAGLTVGNGEWTYLGTASFDHAEVVRPQVGDDLDADGMPDISDNCAPSACTDAGLSADTCANADQRSTRGGMGDACCFVDARYASGRNSNAEAEQDEQVFAYPDFCDPVPLLRIETDPTLVDVPQKSREQVGIRGSTWLGVASDKHLQGYDDAGSGQIGFRFCNCYDGSGFELPEGSCHAQVCSANLAVDLQGGFDELTTVVDKATGMPVTSPSYPFQQFQAAVAGPEQKFVWNWLDSYTAGEINIVEQPINGTIVETTHGFLASSVLRGVQYFSDRDEGAAGRLRTDLVFESVPHREDVPVTIPQPPYFEQMAQCLFGCDRAFLLPWDAYIQELLGYRDYVNDPLLVLTDPTATSPVAVADWDETYLIDLAAAGVDVSALVYPDAAAPWSWIAPVEAGGSLGAMGLDTRALLLAPAGTGATHVARVVASADGIVLDQAQGLTAAATTVVEMPAGGRAVYSAVRDELFLVGGSNLPATSRVRRYDVEANTLTAITIDGAFAPTAQVLGTAFDPVANRLYVLDVDGDAARLVAHDLDRETSRKLWTTTYDGLYDSVFLGLDEKQHLVLAVADGEEYTAWSIDPTGPTARFGGRLDGEGMPLNTPMMGGYVLQVPILDDGQMHIVDLTAERFVEGAACSGL